MAIDFEQVLADIKTAQDALSGMRSAVTNYNIGKITVEGIGDISFTAQQKNILKDEYSNLKSNLMDVVGNLP